MAQITQLLDFFVEAYGKFRGAQEETQRATINLHGEQARETPRVANRQPWGHGHPSYSQALINKPTTTGKTINRTPNLMGMELTVPATTNNNKSGTWFRRPKRMHKPEDHTDNEGEASPNASPKSAGLLLYKRAQLFHHMENWRQTPEHVVAKLNDFKSNMHPPNTTALFKENLDQMINGWNRQLLDLYQQHLLGEIHKTDLLLAAQQSNDWEKDREFAARTITKNLSRAKPNITNNAIDYGIQKAKEAHQPTRGRARKRPSTIYEEEETVGEDGSTNSSKESAASIGSQLDLLLNPALPEQTMEPTANQTNQPDPPSQTVRPLRQSKDAAHPERSKSFNAERSTSRGSAPILDRKIGKINNQTNKDLPAKVTTPKANKTARLDPAERLALLHASDHLLDLDSGEDDTIILEATELACARPSAQPSGARMSAPQTKPTSTAEPMDQSYQQFLTKTHFHNKLFKEQWSIDIGRRTKVLIIGDSNVRLLQETPDDWEVHCFPGANYRNIQKVLTNIPRSANMGRQIDIVLTVGINHREEPPASFIPDLNYAHNLLQISGHRTYFNGVSILNADSTLHANNINIINQQWRSIRPESFIEPRRTELNTHWDKDVSDPPIHYSNHTVAAIKDNIYLFLKEKEINRRTALDQAEDLLLSSWEGDQSEAQNLPLPASPHGSPVNRRETRSTARQN